MKKQIISLFMAITMVLSTLPLSAFAVEEPSAPAESPGVTEPLPPIDALGETTPPVETEPPTEELPPAETKIPGDSAVEEAVQSARRLFPFTSEEALIIVPTYSGTSHNAELYYTDGTPYSLSFGITASTVEEPTLMLTVPKGITVSYYPTAMDTTLAGSLAEGDAVTKATDADGTTVLIYRFKPHVASIGFNINLAPTYALKHDADIAVTARYYGGDVLLKEETASIHTYNSAVAGNSVYPSFSWNSDYYNNVMTSKYGEFITAMQFAYGGHYPYDAATLVAAVPDGAVIGFGSGEDFAPLEANKSYPISDSYGGYTVTYHADYDFLAADGTSLGTGQAVVYALNADNSFLSSNSGLCFFKANLFLDFAEPGTHNKGVGAKVSIVVDCEPMVKTQHSKTTSTSSTMNFIVKPYNLADFLYWRYYYMQASYGNANEILPLENNSYLYSTLYNRTGETLTNVKIRYVVDEKLYAGKVTFNLNENHAFYPSRAVVKYRTQKGGATIQTVTLSSYDKVLELADKTDAITEMTVTYDKLGTNGNNDISLCQIYLVNRDGVNDATARRIEMQIISATSPTYGNFEDIWTQYYCPNIYLKNQYVGTVNNTYIYPSSINKGDEFYIYAYGGVNIRTINPTFYLVMPPEYIFVRYDPQGDYFGGQYTLTTRTLSNGDILYKLHFTDGVKRSNTYQNFYFKVGPSVDTSTIRTETLPRLFCMENEDSMFPYNVENEYYRYLDVEDFNENGSRTDYISKEPSLPRVQINSVSTLFTQALLTTDVQDGTALTQPYRYNSSGTYKFYVFNGFQSSVSPKDLSVTITVPKRGASVSYKDKTYTSAWEGALTGPAQLDGAFWDGAGVTYSRDGGSTYTTSTGNWAAVTHVKIRSAAGKTLPQSSSATVLLPFAAVFPEDITASDRAYFGASMDYTLTGTVSGTETAITEPVTMTPATTDLSGTIFKDYNANNVQEENEKTAGKSYAVLLYKGDTATGTAVAFSSSDSVSGKYAVGALLPGKYTAKVTKGSDEYYNSVGSLFDETGCYSFIIGGSDRRTGVNLGIISPRTLSLTYGSYNIKSDTPVKIGYTLSPALLSGESMVFRSSNEDVVTVSADGTMTYVGDGPATITITAPQLAAVITQGGAATIVKTAGVSAQSAGCRITAAPTTDKGTASKPITADTLTFNADGISATYTYRYGRGGYCNNAAHAGANAVKWEISDDDGTGAALTTKGDAATLTSKNAGSITLTAMESWRHDVARKPEPLTLTVTIPKAAVAKPTPVIGAYSYDGTEQTVTVAENPLYTISGNSATEAGAHIITVALKTPQNYQWADGTVEDLTFRWNIGKASIKKPVATGEYTYKAVPQKLVLTSSNLHTIVGDTATDAGNYTATVTLKDAKNYMWADGSTTALTFPWSIGRAIVAAPTVTDKLTYNGREQKAPVPGSKLYRTSADTATNAGTHTATVSLSDTKNYTWVGGSDAPITVDWEIVRAKIEKPIVTGDFVYTGTEQTVPIPKSDRYSVSGNTATDAGRFTAKVTLTDPQNYEWADGTTDDLTFDWKIGIASVPMPAPATETLTYNGKEQSAGIAKSKRYTVTGDAATSAGAYSATVTLADSKNHQWSDGTTAPLTLAWAITKKPLTDKMVFCTAEKVYSGNAITLDASDFTVSDDGALTAVDWYISGYAGNVNVGKAALTIQAAESGNYIGTAVATFEIIPAVHDKTVSVEKIEPQLYTGKAITPEPIVRWGDKVLILDMDYTLSYENNVQPGTEKAKITVTFTGNYSGTAAATFSIFVPSSPTYRIKVTANEGGTATPGSVWVSEGSNKTFAIAPDMGYEIADVLVDGKSVGAVASYAFKSVRASHTIEAQFQMIAGLPYYMDGEGKVFIGFSADGKYLAPKGVTVLHAENPKNFLDIASCTNKADIAFVTEREIFVGTEPLTFAPTEGMSHAMVATVLGRLYERSFGALPNARQGAAWYEPYYTWAVTGNILSGEISPATQITQSDFRKALSAFAEYIHANATLSLPSNADAIIPRAEAATIVRKFVEEIVNCQRQTPAK